MVHSLQNQLVPVNKPVQCFHRYSREGWTAQTFPYHRHNAYEILLFLRGDIHYYVEQACYYLSHGDMILINPDELHRAVCFDEKIYERICFHIKQSVIDRLSSAKTNLLECFESHPRGEKKIIHLNNEQIKQIVLIAHELEHCLANDGYGNDILADALTSQLLVAINTSYQGSAHQRVNIMPDLIREMMLCIKEHIDEPIYLEHLEKHFFLSGTYLSREFKKYTGLTLRSYILEERITQSKALLSEGKNVSEACYQSGFSDYSNFIRSFKKTVGISPGQYKKTVG